ncbi:MAG: PH domain-containing protein [Theionarchaea archaeon]|nr:PH domain-containing protein [Theionarchaea archaeon]
MGSETYETESVLSDELIKDRFRKYLTPDESEFYYVFGQKKASSMQELPLLALFGALLGPLTSAVTTKNFFIGLTQKRLLLMRVSLTYEEVNLNSFPLSEIGGIKIEDSPTDIVFHVLLRTGETYRIEVRKKLHVVEKQEENLKKICQRLTV